MRNNATTLSLLLSASLLLTAAASCKKDELYALPKATQDGKNTAGWLLDGQARVPQRSTISTGSPVDGYWRKTKGGYSLGMSFRQISADEDWGVTFFVPNIRQAGTFVLNQIPAITSGLDNSAYGQFYQQRPSPSKDCYTGPDAPGQLIITRFDTINNIVSGTFEMTPREDGGTATVAITQGRFDLRFDR